MCVYISEPLNVTGQAVCVPSKVCVVHARIGAWCGQCPPVVAWPVWTVMAQWYVLM